MAPSSSATTSVQVALRIRPPTNQDSTSIPARFQRTVIHATSPTSVAVEASSSAPASGGAAGAAATTNTTSASKKQTFSFDQVHDPSTTQHTLFTSTALPLVSRFIEGFNCTILAYGQTSSGKTFTMTGIDLDANPSDPNNGMGIIPRAVSTIFTQARQLKEERGNTWNYSIKGSFIEIYNEDLIDLLSMDDSAGGRREVQIREDKDGHIIWGGLREVNVKNPNEVMTLIRKGTSIRRTNETDMNAQSSRSHAIFSLTFTQKKYSGSGAPPRSSSPLPPGGRSPSRLARPGSVYSGPGSTASASGTRVGSPTFGRPATPSFAAAMGRGGGLRPSSALGHAGDRTSAGGDEEGGEWTTIVSKFHFVDLAGSERLKRTAAAGERIKEGISINSGLLALGNVISALGDPSRAKSHTATHVPYRDSKLTRLLQDSLGGNAHTLMIACVSPAEWNTGETVNTLKYANRARNIKNRAVVNEKEDGWDDVEWLQGTVTRLRKEVKVLKSGGSVASIDATAAPPDIVEGAGKKVLAQMTELQNNYEDLRSKFVDRTEELTRLRRELGEKHRQAGSSGAASGTGKYEEIVGPVIEEYEKTIAAMEAELSLNRAALRHTNEMVEEKEEELAVITERHTATELYVEELRARVAKLSEREASTEAYVRDLEDKMRSYDETVMSSSESMSDLKREVARYKETDNYSVKYIADLEARLSRSDESVISLQQSVERLEKESEQRLEQVQVLQSRLDALSQDGDNWRTDLEQREAKVRELELKMEEWEKKKQDAGDARIRLGTVVDEVAAARKSLEVDLSLSPAPSPVKELSEGEALALNGFDKGFSSSNISLSAESPTTSNPTGVDPSLQKEFAALQQTHNATLADLSSVTTKYRDALREISDLAAQIQEAKLASATGPESVADTTDSERPPEKPIVRRRMTSGRLREASETQYNTGGRRLFFRQAASTESLHSRSLSQSQSLSQELSSARSRKHSSSSHGTASSHSPSNSHSALLSSPRLNLSISLPNGLANFSPPERSAVSLEKEIMRLQEVLKEREAEISNLELSLKASQDESLSAVQSAASHPPHSELELESNENGCHEDEPITPESFLSPRTINKFEHIRRSMQFHNESVNGQDQDSVSASGSVVSDTDESLDRLNELMLSMAQKESSHREVVDSLTNELTQTRRQLDELIALSRDQTLNMSTEMEALREKHQSDLKELAEVQRRESALLDLLSKAEAEHAAAVEEIRASHSDALMQKQNEMDVLLSRLKEEHDSALSILHDELATASSALEQALQNHEDAFGKLRQEHKEELRSKLQEASDTLALARQEHEAALSQIASTHTEEIKRKDSQSTALIQQTEEEYYNALTKLRSDHAETIERHAAESATALEKLKEEHAAELRMTVMAKESLLSESQSSRGLALRELQDEHSSAISRKEASHVEDLERLKAEHVRSLADKDESAEIELGKLRSAMARKETTLAEELEKANSDHAAILSSVKADHASILSSVQASHAAALSSAQVDHASALALLQAEHSSQLDQLHAEHGQLLSKLTEEQKFESKRLENALTSLQNDSSSAAADARAMLDAAIQSQKEQQALLLEDITRTHEAELQELKAAHEQTTRAISTASDEKVASLLEAHTAESLKLRSLHQQEITELNNSIVALQTQHQSSLEDARLTGERTVAETTQRLQATLEDLKSEHIKENGTLRKENELLVQELEAHKVAADEFLLRDQDRQGQDEQIAQKDASIRSMQETLSGVQSERDGLASELAKLRAEFDRTLKEQSLLVQEASKRESLSVELERHRSVLAELQENLQKVKDEKDILQTEKGRSDTLVRELQAQIARSASPPNGRPNGERSMTFNRPGINSAKLPPPTPPPSVPPPPAPRTAQHDAAFSISSATTSSGLSSSSRDSQQASESPATPVTSLGHGSLMTPTPLSAAPDSKVQAKIDEQAKQLDEQEAMIKTLNKQLTHCESDLQTHMDLVSTLETSLGDSEKNLRKARMHATELARERDRLNGEIETLRKELTETKREVVNVRQSIVEEKQSYEQRLDEERKAKERARQQLDSRMDELSKRKSKFACL